MATVTKCVCDICGAEYARPFKILVYKIIDSTKGKMPVTSVESLDLCNNCALEATNIRQCNGNPIRYTIDSLSQKEESLASNEGWINIYEEDGKESPYISYRAYKTKKEALKKAEEYGGNGDYLKTIKIKW